MKERGRIIGIKKRKKKRWKGKDEVRRKKRKIGRKWKNEDQERE